MNYSEGTRDSRAVQVALNVVETASKAEPSWWNFGGKELFAEALQVLSKAMAGEGGPFSDKAKR